MAEATDTPKATVKVKEVAEGKPKQQKLKGMVPEPIAAVEKKADALRDIRLERMDLTQRECKAQDDLLKVMREHKIKEYRLDNTIFVITQGKDKVAMKQVSDSKDDE